jgi:hypothetical protein
MGEWQGRRADAIRARRAFKVTAHRERLLSAHTGTRYHGRRSTYWELFRPAGDERRPSCATVS